MSLLHMTLWVFIDPLKPCVDSPRPAPTQGYDVLHVQGA